MLTLHAALLLALCICFPSLILADSPPPQSAHVYWRWKDEGNSNPKDLSIFSGHATITWIRNAGCETSNGLTNYKFFVTPESPVDVKAETMNKSKDFMDPKTIDNWAHARTTAAATKCDAHMRTTFTVHNADRTQRMIIRLPDICNDHDCKGPNKEKPNVQCLAGPKGNVVMYLDKWINPCFDP